MNRAKRRSLERLTPEQLIAILDRERLQATREAVHRYSVAMALVLRDRLGFGKTRIHRFLNYVETLFKDIQEGQLTLEDVEKQLDEELDVLFKQTK